MAKYLIVGGNSGIGERLIEELLEEKHEVLQWSRKKGQFSSEFEWQQLDLGAELPQVPDVLDGVVYLPGSISLKPFHRFSDADFRSDFEVNALGAARVLQVAMPALKKSQRKASVVYFSTVAVQTGLPFHASVAMAKGAVEGLTRALAAEWAPKIRVNAIAPSLTDTPLAGQILNSELKRKASADRHPLKCVGDSQGIARLAAYLLSENADFITGQIIFADGGLGSLRC
jgi:3-oxoacyl-[acyl-carrier protein] reductase